MGKRTNVQMYGLAQRQDGRPSQRQDPVVQRLMERLGSGHRLLHEVLREVMYLQTLGVDVTPEIMDRTVDTIEDRDARLHSVVPVSNPEPRGPQKKRRPSGRFSDVSVAGSVVYYMRIGDRVKIGTSTKLRDRLLTINPEELLAVEQGGPAKELARHEQFAELRTHGEWFRYEGPLAAHIEAIREAST